MENEPNFQVLVASNEQIVDAYPDLFEKLPIDPMPIYIEKNPEQYNQIDRSKDPRIILLPSGIISVMSVMSEDTQDFIWSDCQTEEYKKLLAELNRKAREWSIGNTKESLSSYQETINGKEYAISFFPYQDIHASKVLIDSIDKKLKVVESLEKPTG